MGFHPHLAFTDNCREAFTRYQEIFGGELVLMAMSEMPVDEPVPAGQANLIVHAELTVDGDILMGADDPSGSYDGKSRGGCTNASVESPARAKEIYDALAEGGEVQMPLGETFFSPAFGMCTDRFGTPWMVYVPNPES